MQQLEIWFLEQRLCRPIGIATICNDDIKLVLLLLQKLETIADVSLDIGVLETNGHAREIFLRQPNHSFVNVAEDGLFHGRMLDDFA